MEIFDSKLEIQDWKISSKNFFSHVLPLKQASAAHDAVSPLPVCWGKALLRCGLMRCLQWSQRALFTLGLMEQINPIGKVDLLKITVKGKIGNPLQYFCLENPMDGGAWRATGHRAAKSWTRLKWLSKKGQWSEKRHREGCLSELLQVRLVSAAWLSPYAALTLFLSLFEIFGSKI